ncbi:MAG: phosphatidate cytidylyltransferase [Marmoricola sp.]
MTQTTPAPADGPGKSSRAGRDLPAAIASGVVLGGAVIVSLVFWKPAFMIIVAAAVVVATWEMHRGLQANRIEIAQQPLMVGGVAIVGLAYVYGPVGLVGATAVSALATLLWLLRRGVPGYVANATASIFTLVYVPFLAGFVGLMLAEPGSNGAKAVFTFVVVTIASDIGGYVAGVLFGRHRMAPVISPKKSWEGFAGSTVACVVAGWLLVVHLLDGPWWAGVVLGVVGVVMATLGDLVESVMKRDLGIKDMSQIIPGHGGLMDRMDSLLVLVAPAWLVLHFLVF